MEFGAHRQSAFSTLPPRAPMSLHKIWFHSFSIPYLPSCVLYGCLPVLSTVTHSIQPPKDQFHKHNASGQMGWVLASPYSSSPVPPLLFFPLATFPPHITLLSLHSSSPIESTIYPHTSKDTQVPLH